MSRRTILIIVTIVLIALVGWVYVAVKNNAAKSESEKAKSVLGTLFPFGDSGTPKPSEPATPEIPIVKTPETPEAPAKISRLTQVSNKMVAGYTVIVPPPVAPTPKTKTPTKPAVKPEPVATPEPTTPKPIVYPEVRFVERGTGYVFTTNAKAQNEKKISGTVIARTAEALLGDNGETVLFRYIKNDNKTIASYLGKVILSADPATPGSLKGDFLPDNILDVVLSPDKKNFLILLPTGDGSAGLSMKTDGSSKKQLFTSPLSEWLLDWTTGGGIALTTKAASSVPGYAYTVVSSSIFQKIIGGIQGLTTKMSPDGKSLLFSISKTNSVSLHVQIQDGTDFDTGLLTLPEKCIWANDSTIAYCGASPIVDLGVYPDNWYQGSTHFNDALWMIDVKAKTTKQLSDGEGKYLDAVHLSLDQDGKYLFFMNKNDSSLWSLDMTPTPVAAPVIPILPTVQ